MLCSFNLAPPPRHQHPRCFHYYSAWVHDCTLEVVFQSNKHQCFCNSQERGGDVWGFNGSVVVFVNEEFVGELQSLLYWAEQNFGRVDFQ